jgi:hypothetical protein
MRIRAAVLSTLSLLPIIALHGCVSTYGCDPDDEDFELDAPLTADEVDTLVEASYSAMDWASLTCDFVCEQVYAQQRGWTATTVTSCELVLPEKEDGAGAAGRITCAGRGLEYYCEGRRPLDHVEAGDEGCADPLGRYFAAAAYLEASSVVAFEELAAWLRAHAAPQELVARCEAAAAEERLHTRWMTRLARQRGASPPSCARGEARAATALEVARHNAVEGCVFECFAAMMAAARGRLAEGRAMRRIFARIAADEARHGELAWDLHTWLLGQLDRDQAAEVAALRAAALAGLPARAAAAWREAPGSLGQVAAADVEALAGRFAALLAAA